MDSAFFTKLLRAIITDLHKRCGPGAEVETTKDTAFFVSEGRTMFEVSVTSPGTIEIRKRVVRKLNLAFGYTVHVLREKNVIEVIPAMSSPKGMKKKLAPADVSKLNVNPAKKFILGRVLKE